jgi:hypothetical protein
METLEKSELALRLLDRAIAMYFDGEDPLFVMTLAHPAHLILQNLAERQFPNKNMSHIVWNQLEEQRIKELEDGSVIENYNGFLNFLHRVPNAAKHANKATETHVSYDESHPVSIIVMAVAHAEQLGCTSSAGVRFAMWLALLSDHQHRPEFLQAAEIEFPGLRQMAREEQLSAGREAIAKTYQS